MLKGAGLSNEGMGLQIRGRVGLWGRGGDPTAELIIPAASQIVAHSIRGGAVSDDVPAEGQIFRYRDADNAYRLEALPGSASTINVEEDGVLEGVSDTIDFTEADADVVSFAGGQATVNLGLYQREAEKGANNGYAPLDAGGLVLKSDLPVLKSPHQYVFGNDEADGADITTGAITRFYSTTGASETCTRITVHALTTPASGNLVFDVEEASAEDLSGATWSNKKTVTFVAAGGDPDSHIVSAPAFSFTARRPIRINITTAPAGWKDITIILEVERTIV